MSALELEAKMAELAARFDARAPEERAALRAAVAKDDRAAVAARAHKLAGIAGMFGRPEIGAAALNLEEVAESDADMTQAADRLDALLAALAD